MKSQLALFALAGAVCVGCSKKASDVPVNSSATDISAPAPYTPPAPATHQPVTYDTMPSGGGATGSGTYTVKRGDTLYGIARTRYGDGKQWQKIASANPGVTPQSLKVGQTLVIP
ncbi:MAG: LysM peptidoglycan-binding domain-containing protein [Tepidisphaeraceae bacterium]